MDAIKASWLFLWVNILIPALQARTRKLSRIEGLPQAARPAAEFCSRRSVCSLTVSVHLSPPRPRLCPGDAAFVPPLCGGFPYSLWEPARGFPTHGSPKSPHGSPTPTAHLHPSTAPPIPWAPPKEFNIGMALTASLTHPWLHTRCPRFLPPPLISDSRVPQ